LALKTINSNRLWIGGGVAAVIGLVFAAFDPLSWVIFPRCILHSMTGWYCPGCGTGRAVAQLAHGHWLTALRLNPVTVLGLPVIGALWATGRLDRVRPVWIWTMLAVLVVFGVLRNLPWPPFIWLAP
jgi:hypothetical protein